MPRRVAMPRLSAKEALILQLLANSAEMYGLQLVAKSRGRLKRGTVYVTLGRMEEKGYVKSRLDNRPSATGGMPRRLYEATAYGVRVSQAWSEVARFLKAEPVR